MKYFFLIGFILLLSFTRFLMTHNEDPYLSQEEKLVNSILGKTAEMIKKKYNIKPSGEGSAMPEGIIEGLTLTFDTKDKLSKEQLRKLLIECAKELVMQVKMNSGIEPFLANPPFNIQNVQIIIYNHDKDGRGLHDPAISTAEISRGVLTYRTMDPNDRFRFKNQFQETYNEAMRILQK